LDGRPQERPGRDLGYTRFDKMAEAFGGYAEYVEKAADIRPALERAMAAVKAGQPALVNVVTDWRARATTADFVTFRMRLLDYWVLARCVKSNLSVAYLM
jgi:thiamine pyrophosphate-dependent acetolactate synthase large subunit-like protein